MFCLSQSPIATTSKKKSQFASIAIYLADGMQTLGIAARLKLLNQQSVTMQKVG